MKKIKHSFEVTVEYYDRDRGIWESDIEAAIDSISGLEKITVSSNGEEEI